jgi:site-specific recombinase XerD
MAMQRSRALGPEVKDDVRHPTRVWAELGYEQESLRRLVDEYVSYLRGRPERISPATITKYANVLASFLRSVHQSGEPAILGSLTLHAVGRWIASQRELRQSEEGIASRLAALKVFTRKYLWLHLELTTCDLLAKVPRISTKGISPKEGLTDDERDAVLNAFDRGTYEDIRNQALIAVYLSTGLRFNEVLQMGTDYDKISGDFTVTAKGGKERPVRMSPRSLKLVRRYHGIRPATGSSRLWLTETGQPVSYWGGQSIFKRIKVRSDVPRVHAHLLRHTFAQGALTKGAERAAVQDMLGHTTDAMTRRYSGAIRQQTAAAMMPQYSTI